MENYVPILVFKFNLLAQMLSAGAVTTQLKPSLSKHSPCPANHNTEHENNMML